MTTQELEAERAYLTEERIGLLLDSKPAGAVLTPEELDAVTKHVNEQIEELVAANRKVS